MKTVEIFEEENSIIIDDEFDTTDYSIYPEDKKFKISSSVKDDCFFNHQTVEYKISVNPIEIYVRTLELSHEPPLKYSIKDGVVLESELSKEKFVFSDRMENLKKQVEWQKVSILASFEVNLYLLSQHPEIISKEEYRRFLRQSIERIKVGVMKVEEVITKDTHGLQIHTDKYGKSIWYPNNEKERVEMDKYYELPEEERKGTKYAQKIEYVEKCNDSLFKEDSLKYAGITDFEFKESEAILAYIEKLLDKKETTAIRKNGVKSSTKMGDRTKWIIVIVLSIIALSGGIWTAIGVFVLGSIIISILSK